MSECVRDVCVSQQRDVVGERVPLQKRDGSTTMPAKFGTVVGVIVPGVVTGTSDAECDAVAEDSDIKVLIAAEKPPRRRRQPQNRPRNGDASPLNRGGRFRLLTLKMPEVIDRIRWMNECASGGRGRGTNGTNTGNRTTTLFRRFACVYPGCKQQFQTRLQWFDHILACKKLTMTDLAEGAERTPISVYVGDKVQTRGLFRAFETYSTAYIQSACVKILSSTRCPPPLTLTGGVAARGLAGSSAAGANPVPVAHTSTDTVSPFAYRSRLGVGTGVHICAEADVQRPQRNYDVAGHRMFSGGTIVECQGRPRGESCLKYGCWNHVVQQGVQVPLQVSV